MDTLTPAPAATPAASRRPPMAVARRPLLCIALAASAGAALIYLSPIAAQLRVLPAFGVLFALLGIAQLSTVAAALVRPTRTRLYLAAAAAGVVFVLWAMVRLGHVLAVDPWQPVNSVLGFTDDICAFLCWLAVVLLVGLAAKGRRRNRPSVGWRLLTAIPVALLVPVVGLSIVVGLITATDGFSWQGFPAATVAPEHLPAGQRSTVEYCRPNGNPLAMDIYMPAAPTPAAPAVLYVHGGGLVIGGRGADDLGATLADQDGALFTPLQRELTKRGFVVASIDYRLAPASSWPAPIQDARCAVRFLRAHAASLGIDPNRIGSWGSSAGGVLASLLGLAGPGAGFDTGQYADQSGQVDAVVDMFGPGDVTTTAATDPSFALLLDLGFGTSAQHRVAASAARYIRQGAPPFLVLQGDEDTNVKPETTKRFTGELRANHVPTTFIEVHGTGHTLASLHQNPSPQRLVGTVADFLTRTLG